MLLQYAREHHFPNPTFFVDDGVSGVTYDRPGFQAMLAEIEAGRVAVAIAKDLSRLGRNSALTGLYTNFTFPKNGVRFIAINDNYDTIDPNRVDNDFAGIKNWFNEFYARDTSRKIRAVQKAKGERGVPLTTNVPYGYVKDLENPRRWVVDPVAADVVKRIFDLCMKGRGPMQIANQLKADKVLSSLGKQIRTISSSTIRKSSYFGFPLEKAPGTFSQHIQRGRMLTLSRPRAFSANRISRTMRICSIKRPERAPARPALAPATERS